MDPHVAPRATRLFMMRSQDVSSDLSFVQSALTNEQGLRGGKLERKKKNAQTQAAVRLAPRFMVYKGALQPETLRRSLLFRPNPVLY